MPGAERDTETGRYVNKYPPEAFLEALKAEDGIAGTTEVAEQIRDKFDADEVDETLKSITYKNLSKLHDQGEIDCKKIGSTNAWMLPDE